MSLDGLDARDVNEAYALALGEGGGWFLLKYTGRAAVGLLGKGLAGLSEVREAIERYDEQSPLYGFLQYRRRKVVFKYVPEGTSRLLLARMSIHFQAITEKLAPHYTIFSFTSSAELNDTALSASCSLHTASASIKSSNDSLRQSGLAEITEDVRENQVTTANNQEWSKFMDRPSLVQSTPNGVEQPGYLSSDKENHRPNSSKHSASTVSSRSGSNMDKALPPTPAELSRETERPKTSVKYDEYEVRPSLDGRPSSQSLRASTRDLHSAHGYKPKVKLGPRPSTDSRSRPPTANPSSRATDTRPISTLPAGLSMPVRKAVSATPKSPQSQVHPHIMDSIASNLQSAPLLPTKTPPTKTEPTKSTKRPTSGLQGDLRAPAQGPSPKTPTMTPEKRRLMKALQLRQKQMAAQSFQETFEDKPVPAAADAQPSTKSTHEDSIMKRSVDVFSVDEDSNIVHVGMKVFDKELPVNSEVSPISITEPSDGPSTQASSISDEDETSAKQEKTTGMTESSEQHADIELMSAGSYGENPMPKASSSPQSPETYIKEEDTKKTASELERPPIHAPFTGERPVLPIEPDTLQNSALPTESPPKIVSSFLRSTSDVISPQEVLVPAISEDDDPSLGPLELSYTDMNVLLPFLSQNTAPQVPHVQVTSHTRDEDEIRTNPRPSTADTIADDRQHHGPILSVKRVSETSDENFLSDDSFMEELKDAVVQEAKPISVSKSPITPVFPRRGSDLGSEHGRTARSVSNPLRRTSREDLLSPNQQMPLSARSFSIPESQNFATKPTQILLPTKVGVSSGISQRIKALEKLSSRPPSPSGSQHTSSTTSPPYINLRKSSLRSTPAAPDPPKYSGHKSRQSVPYHSPSPPPPPEADLTKSMDPPILETSSKRGKSRPESISVTAKIIRGGRNQVPEVPLNPSEPCAVDLYQSPLTVDHQPREGTSKPELSPLKPPTRQWASNMSISSSSTEHQSEPTKASRRDSFMSRRSMSSRRGSDVDLRRSISETSLATLTMDGKKGERKDSKKSRLFKRMSNISSASRRSIVQALSPTLKEESIAERHEPVYEAPRTTIDVGDINVQFPDTLLWKRRHMIIDHGTLVLSPSKADNNSKVQTKHFSLAEFYPPYIPDQDRQELPNSVMLDFKDGSTLQCASENPDGQAHVLQALKQTHFLHT